MCIGLIISYVALLMIPIEEESPVHDLLYGIPMKVVALLCCLIILGCIIGLLFEVRQFYKEIEEHVENDKILYVEH